MNLRIVCLLAALIGVMSCKKDDAPLPENHYGETFQIQFMIDGVPLSRVYPADKINDKATYIIDSLNGSYFGGGPVYYMGGYEPIEIFFATGFGNLKTNWDSAFASLGSLCAPGNKTYDSINDVTQTRTNRVEIIYIDTSGTYSTTKTVQSGGRSKSAGLPIDQAGSSFVITSEKLVSTTNTKNNAVLIKGTFNCTVYKFNTFKARKITNGSFVAVFDVI